MFDFKIEIEDRLGRWQYRDIGLVRRRADTGDSCPELTGDGRRPLGRRTNFGIDQRFQFRLFRGRKGSPGIAGRPPGDHGCCNRFRSAAVKKRSGPKFRTTISVSASSAESCDVNASSASPAVRPIACFPTVSARKVGSFSATTSSISPILVIRACSATAPHFIQVNTTGADFTRGSGQCLASSGQVSSPGLRSSTVRVSGTAPSLWHQVAMEA